MTHVTVHQLAAWIAAGGGGWAIVRAGTAKGVLKAKSPARCAACGRERVHGRCPCTADRLR